VARGAFPSAIPDGTDAVVAEGGRPREGAAIAGWAWLDLLVRDGARGPRLVVPIGRPNVARYVLTRWSHPHRRWFRARNRVTAEAVGRGLVPRPLRVAVATRAPGLPYLVDAGRALGVPDEADWFLSLGDGDEFQRGTFHVLRRDAAVPEWVVKFARIPGDDAPFRAEADAHALLARRAPMAAARVPSVLGRCDVDAPAAVETAAPGPGLHAVLDADGPRGRKLALIDDVVSWLGALGDESRGPATELEPERTRLAREVLPAWPAALRDLVAVGPALCPVLAHHDAGSWNMVDAPNGVMVLDWESARYPAMPLWDLLYFLTDALVALHGPAADDVKVALALLRGELPESDRLFRALRAGAARAGVARDDVGPIATLAWLHHGTSPARRRVRAEQADRPGDVGIGLLTRLAEPWLTDPALGPRWPAFPR
jgi:hypothetical protein